MHVHFSMENITFILLQKHVNFPFRSKVQPKWIFQLKE